ncbi:MAG: acyl--CoA ligase [Burkholderiaceae bacterium]|jgi:long-chain acyl-CoA synthetase|nr:acyl--CoA ligase [Burkholderiaceae bacterium]
MSDTTRTLVEHWALVQPDRPAVIAGGATLSWRELNTLADNIAHQLARRGAGPGTLVALRTQTGSQWVALMLALSKLKARMLGVNRRLVADEVNYVLENARAELLILDDEQPQALIDAISALPRQAIIAVSRTWEHSQWKALTQPGGAVLEMPELCAQVIYTSGTTGKPKGVQLNNRPEPGNERLNRYLAACHGGYKQYTPSDVVLVSMPLHHGSGPSQVRQAIKSGSTLVLQNGFDPAEWFDLVEKHGVTYWTGVPTMYKRLKSYQEASGRAAPRLKSMGIGAAPVPMAIKYWVQEQFGPVLHEGYGASETGMISSMQPEEHLKKPGSSGRPYEGVAIEIRSGDGKPCATDQVGEIWVNTPVAIKNYLNAPPLDQDTRDARGFFRTGDMGRVDSDGYLYITDRSKDMIISGGVNIYPAEIEAVFYRHPGLLDIAVIGAPDDEFGERVIAYYESKTGQPIAAEELAALAQAHLASYKRPRSFVHVTELPRNTVGKLLKRDLRQPHWSNQERNV